MTGGDTFRDYPEGGVYRMDCVLTTIVSKQHDSVVVVASQTRKSIIAPTSREEARGVLDRNLEDMT